MDKGLLRIVDVNYNRAKEALRVIEDLFRFLIENKSLTTKAKRLRHGLTKALKAKAILKKSILQRNSEGDFGKRVDGLELDRKDSQDILYANFQRAKESLRVLEETFKIIDKKSVCRIKALRYNLYSLEKSAYTKAPLYNN